MVFDLEWLWRWEHLALPLFSFTLSLSVTLTVMHVHMKDAQANQSRDICHDQALSEDTQGNSPGVLHGAHGDWVTWGLLQWQRLLKNLQWMQWDNYSLRYWSRLRSRFLTWKQSHTWKHIFKSYTCPWNHKGQQCIKIFKWLVFVLQNAADNQNPYHNFMACEGFTVCTLDSNTCCSYTVCSLPRVQSTWSAYILLTHHLSLSPDCWELHRPRGNLGPVTMGTFATQVLLANREVGWGDNAFT